MEEEHSNGRRAFQWKKSIPMEEGYFIEEFRRRKLEKAAAESAAAS